MIKEWILLSRDRVGLLFLFLMPLILVVVMALLQDAPFKDYQDLKFEILFLDHDKDLLGDQIKKGLIANKQFSIVDSLHHETLTEEQLSKKINSGSYKIGIIIPTQASLSIKKIASKSATQIMEGLGVSIEAEDLSKIPDSANIQLLFDPATKQSFRSAITYALEKIINQSQMQMMINYLTQSEDTTSNIVDVKDMQAIRIIPFEKDNSSKNLTISNSVQHNVPAWSIFAIFFILIPIAGSMIEERENGVKLRMHLIPGHYTHLLIGKITAFMVVNVLQFISMLWVGIYLMPYFGLPSLQLGFIAPTMMLLVAISFAASSFAVLIGNLFHTQNQALSFGAIIIVLMSAIGGIWIPVEVMPPFLQKLSYLSPLQWSQNGINDIFLRHGSWNDVMLEVILLMGFSITCLIITFFSRSKFIS